jgi:hypothetical protein
MPGFGFQQLSDSNGDFHSHSHVSCKMATVASFMQFSPDGKIHHNRAAYQESVGGWNEDQLLVSQNSPDFPQLEVSWSRNRGGMIGL